MTNDLIIAISSALRAQLDPPGYLIHEGCEQMQVDGNIDIRQLAEDLEREFAFMKKHGDVE